MHKRGSNTVTEFEGDGHIAHKPISHDESSQDRLWKLSEDLVAELKA